MAVVVGKTQAVTFLRHGQSQGNVAKSLGMDRKRDERLVDCGLTKLGAQQAAHVADNMAEAPELIVASPLARALATALLLKTGAPMVVHPGVREIGSRIPENRTRPVAALKRDGALAALPGFDDVDFALVEDLRDGAGPRDARPSSRTRRRLASARVENETTSRLGARVDNETTSRLGARQGTSPNDRRRAAEPARGGADAAGVLRLAAAAAGAADMGRRAPQHHRVAAAGHGHPRRLHPQLRPHRHRAERSGLRARGDVSGFV